LFLKKPLLRAEAVDLSENAAAAAEIGIPLSRDYAEFVARYGGASVGPFRIFELRRAIPMGKNEASFVDVTNGFRRQGWPGVEKWAIISMDHPGNPVGLDKEGRIWISDPDARVAQTIANDFEEYLRKQCLSLEA
jgi:hypothetical protein